MVNRKLRPRKFFTEEEKSRIVRAIREAEDKTSGEIRVYLERHSKGPLLERAKKIFEKLGMTRTKLRNGVLIYFSLRDHNFEILGDRGIHEKVGDDFWKAIVAKIQTFFAKDDFGGGLEVGIHEIGEQLRTYFPRDKQDLNELPDKVEEGR
jgi:uncharacterized membrane protein